MNHTPLPYLRTQYQLYKRSNDEFEKGKIKESMKEILDGKDFSFILPKGWDKELEEIFQLLDYKITRIP
ncbi:hypothetical protein [Enterococcus alishanensis]